MIRRDYFAHSSLERGRRQRPDAAGRLQRERLVAVDGGGGHRLGLRHAGHSAGRASRPGCARALTAASSSASGGATSGVGCARGTFKGMQRRGDVHGRRRAARAVARFALPVGIALGAIHSSAMLSSVFAGGKIRTYVRIRQSDPPSRHGRLLRLGGAGAPPRTARQAGHRRRRARGAGGGLGLLLRGARVRGAQRAAHRARRAAVPARRVPAGRHEGVPRRPPLARRAARAVHRPRGGGVHRRGVPGRHRQPAAVRPAAHHRPPHPGAGVRRARRHLLHRHRAHQAAGQAGRRPQQAGRHRRAHRRRRVRPPARPARGRGLRHRPRHPGAAHRPRPHHRGHAAGRAVPAAGRRVRQGRARAAPARPGAQLLAGAQRAAAAQVGRPRAHLRRRRQRPRVSCAPRCSRSPTTPSPSCAARAWRRARWRSRCASTPSTP